MYQALDFISLNMIIGGLDLLSLMPKLVSPALDK